MAPLGVDPVALDGAGAEVVTAAEGLASVISTLIAALSGCAGMAGDDPAGAALVNHRLLRSAGEYPVTTLLEFFLNYLDFLYLDPRFRITDSSTSGVATNNASLTLTSPVTTWQISNDRAQIQLDIAPTKSADQPRNWFRFSIIRQYLDDYDETNAVPSTEAVSWARDNRSRIDELFSDTSAAQSCEALAALENANAVKYWGPSRP